MVGDRDDVIDTIKRDTAFDVINDFGISS